MSSKFDSLPEGYTSRIVLLDVSNFLHRARAGVQAEDGVTFNFFRSLRSLLATLKPDRLVIVRDGRPRARLELDPQYKGNRKVSQDDPLLAQKLAEREAFRAQCSQVYRLLKNFPFSVMLHPEQECDDVIYNIVKHGPKCTQYVVVSNDSDFVQLMQAHENCAVYNPMKKEFAVAPEFDYLTWKALRGDGADNVKGVKGIGDKKAAAFASDVNKLTALLEGDEAVLKTFTENVEMIKFIDFTDDEMMNVLCSQPVKDWDVVKAEFERLNFRSLLEPAGSFTKFIGPFEKFWLPRAIVSGTTMPAKNVSDAVARGFGLCIFTEGDALTTSFCLFAPEVLNDLVRSKIPKKGPRSGRAFRDEVCYRAAGSSSPIIGYIQVNSDYEDGLPGLEVFSSSAVSGWGPLMYELAMVITGEPLRPDRGGPSADAQRVWKGFWSRYPEVPHRGFDEDESSPVPEGDFLEACYGPVSNVDPHELTVIGDKALTQASRTSGVEFEELRELLRRLSVEHFYARYGSQTG